jgi:ABC-type transport system substrate-binding protein
MQIFPWKALRLPGRLVLAAILLAAGCGNEPGTVRTAAPPPPSGGVLRILSEPARSLDPREIDEVYESVVLRQVYEGLLTLDTALRLEPCLATTWTISTDGLRYVFNLRKGIRFHDGSPLTARDAAFSFQRCLAPDVHGRCLAENYLLHIVGAEDYQSGRASEVRGIRVVDDHTLEIELLHPFSLFLKVLAMDQTVVVSSAYFDGVGAARAEREPNGTGPFRFSRKADGGDAHLARNADYWGTPALLDSLVFLSSADVDTTSESRAIADGRIDFASLSAGGGPEALALGLSVYRSPELSLSFLGLRTDRPPFYVAAVRRAALLAIHRDVLTAKDPEGKVPVFGLLPPGMPGREPVDRMPRPDPEEARRVLAGAGFPDGKGLAPVSIGFWRGGRASRSLANQIRSDLEAVGFDVEIQVYSWSQLDSLAVAGKLQAFSMSWVADLPDPDAFLFPLFHSKGESNLFGYRSSEADNLLDQARVLQPGPERSRTYLLLQERILQDVPLVPLYHSSIAYAWRPEVQGVEIGPTGLALVPFWRVHFGSASSLAQGGPAR